MSEPLDPSPAIRIRDLTVRAGGRALLASASLEVAPGELVLLVGGSGSGKSILLRILAGLVSERTPGLSIAGEVRTTGRVGMVFQQGALFENLTAGGNVSFALDHKPSDATGDAPTAEDLLAEVRIPPSLPLPDASGGQRRRVAIARALANQPDVLLYDEPTAGLDPDLACHVGRLIREAHDSRSTTTFIVTHDFPALSPVADRIVFLDASQASLAEVDGDSLARMVDEGAFHHDPEEPRPPRTVVSPLAALADFFEAWGRSTSAFFVALVGSLLPRWRRPRWGLKALAGCFRLVAGPTSIVYIALAGAVIGFVSIYFSFQYLPFRQYMRPLITDDLLAAIGFALYRILVPILATILIAARCGAAVASDLAGRVYREEFDALQTLGVRPLGLHGFAALTSLTVSTPLLVLVSFFVARTTGLITFGLWDPEASVTWMSATFHAQLRHEAFLYAGTGWMLTKTLTCGFLVGAVALAQGTSPKRSPHDVSRAVTRTVLLSTALVLLVHFAFAFLEF